MADGLKELYVKIVKLISEFKDEEAAQLLETAPHYILSLQDNNRYRIIHYAAKFNSIRVLKKLIALGADLNIKSSNGSPLEVAISEGREACVALLCQQKSVTNKYKLLLAVYGNDLEQVKVLSFSMKETKFGVLLPVALLAAFNQQDHGIYHFLAEHIKTKEDFYYCCDTALQNRNEKLAKVFADDVKLRDMAQDYQAALVMSATESGVFSFVESICIVNPNILNQTFKELISSNEVPWLAERFLQQFSPHPQFDLMAAFSCAYDQGHNIVEWFIDQKNVEVRFTGILHKNYLDPKNSRVLNKILSCIDTLEKAQNCFNAMQDLWPFTKFFLIVMKTALLEDVVKIYHLAKKFGLQFNTYQIFCAACEMSDPRLKLFFLEQKLVADDLACDLTDRKSNKTVNKVNFIAVVMALGKFKQDFVLKVDDGRFVLEIQGLTFDDMCSSFILHLEGVLRFRELMDEVNRMLVPKSFSQENSMLGTGGLSTKLKRLIEFFDKVLEKMESIFKHIPRRGNSIFYNIKDALESKIQFSRAITIDMYVAMSPENKDGLIKFNYQRALSDLKKNSNLDARLKDIYSAKNVCVYILDGALSISKQEMLACANALKEFIEHFSSCVSIDFLNGDYLFLARQYYLCNEKELMLACLKKIRPNVDDPVDCFLDASLKVSTVLSLQLPGCNNELITAEQGFSIYEDVALNGSIDHLNVSARFDLFRSIVDLVPPRNSQSDKAKKNYKEDEQALDQADYLYVIRKAIYQQFKNYYWIITNVNDLLNESSGKSKLSSRQNSELRKILQSLCCEVRDIGPVLERQYYFSVEREKIAAMIKKSNEIDEDVRQKLIEELSASSSDFSSKNKDTKPISNASTKPKPKPKPEESTSSADDSKKDESIQLITPVSIDDGSGEKFTSVLSGEAKRKLKKQKQKQKKRELEKQTIFQEPMATSLLSDKPTYSQAVTEHLAAPKSARIIKSLASASSSSSSVETSSSHISSSSDSQSTKSNTPVTTSLSVSPSPSPSPSPLALPVQSSIPVMPAPTPGFWMPLPLPPFAEIAAMCFKGAQAMMQYAESSSAIINKTLWTIGAVEKYRAALFFYLRAPNIDLAWIADIHRLVAAYYFSLANLTKDNIPLKAKWLYEALEFFKQAQVRYLGLEGKDKEIQEINKPMRDIDIELNNILVSKTGVSSQNKLELYDIHCLKISIDPYEDKNALIANDGIAEKIFNLAESYLKFSQIVVADKNLQKHLLTIARHYAKKVYSYYLQMAPQGQLTPEVTKVAEILSDIGSALEQASKDLAVNLVESKMK